MFLSGVSRTEYNQIYCPAIDNDTTTLETVMLQIRSAFTEAQFHDAASKIHSNPESIIVDASSPLQLKAATLVIKLKQNRELLARADSKLKLETLRAEHRKLLTARQHIVPPGVDPMQDALKHGGNLRRSIEASFQSYLNQTDFWTRSASGWTNHLSQLRNVLQNDYSRFDIARTRAAEYAALLQALSESPDPALRQSKDMEVEIRLRRAALEAYVAALDRLEARGMVERRADARDRRIWRLHLLPPSASVLDELQVEKADMHRMATTDVDAATQAAMIEGLQRMKTTLSVACRAKAPSLSG